MNKKISRRRGIVLENEILDQAWLLFQKMGYSRLTMDDVAHAAKTNKNAIYRRWTQKCHLVMAAVSRHMPSIHFDIADQGSLKGDLTSLFESLNPIFNIIKPDDLRDLVSDMFSNMASYDLFSGISQENNIYKSIEIIITRANHRNEISFTTNTISEKAMKLPFLLIINEMILYGTLLENSIEDIVDNILIPIYTAHK